MPENDTWFAATENQQTYYCLNLQLEICYSRYDCISGPGGIYCEEDDDCYTGPLFQEYLEEAYRLVVPPTTCSPDSSE
ncbi:MAG: hypothetical protein BroJett003_04720 [Planctomycetota bacterium]|nr:MAG: hypothetical protein BroJett003_04720 [Planctomycetota bacterium]